MMRGLSQGWVKIALTHILISIEFAQTVNECLIIVCNYCLIFLILQKQNKLILVYFACRAFKAQNKCFK